jgi:hypothetical protein
MLMMSLDGLRRWTLLLTTTHASLPPPLHSLTTPHAMPTVVRPQTIQTGSRFPAWDKDNSLCFEIAFRRRAGESALLAPLDRTDASS